MKVIERVYLRVVPDKMPEALDILKRHHKLAQQLGQSHIWRGYRSLTQVDTINTIVLEYEWDSFAALDKYLQNSYVNGSKEYKDVMASFQTVYESLTHEFYLTESWGLE